jgi:hypothetical protein
MMARFWRLSMDVQVVLGTHHCFDARSAPHALSAVICISERVANAAGYAVEEGPDVGVEGDSTPALDRHTKRQFDLACNILKLSDAELADIIRKSDGALEKMVL